MSAKKQTAKTEDTMTTTASDAPAAEWVDLDQLHGWEKNPKKHPDARVRDLMRSIKRFGWGAVILAQPDGEVIAGHGRMEAAKRLGMPKVPVRWMKLDPAEAHLLALADNRLTEIGEWDDATVRQILEAAKAEGADIGGLGWTDEELLAILTGKPEDEEPDDLDTSPQLGDGLQSGFVAACPTEEEQSAPLERFEMGGPRCHALIS